MRFEALIDHDRGLKRAQAVLAGDEWRGVAGDGVDKGGDFAFERVALLVGFLFDRDVGQTAGRGRP